MGRSGATNVQINNLLKREFGGVAYTQPATWYVGLSTTTIQADGTGVTEPSSGAGYARVAVTNNTTNFVVDADLLTMENGTVIQFNPATANWSQVTYAALYDAATGGVPKYYMQLENPKTVEIEDILRIEPGRLQIQILQAV